MKLEDAIKIAENVSVDYSGMTQDEVDQMDEALTMIFACAKKIDLIKFNIYALNELIKEETT